ncbi:MAG: diguanylate cyclase [Holophagaceae bacterium]|uniref:diguanylate cyclase n=1 Tax=Candidatus Geothrix skivensis TaxID=2954439 RepID=A0A9D7XLK5_9BACT|nr:diguanylate cyclase [Candidatus Geothrix skivensis]
MIASAPPTLPALQPALPIAIQSLVAGMLVALALLSILAYRPLRDGLLSRAGVFGLLAAAAWISFSDIASSLLPASLLPLVHPTSLLLAGICLVVWERVTAELLAASPGAQGLARSRRLLALATLGIASVAVLPWNPIHTSAERLLSLLAPLLALLTLAAGWRAHREGSGSAPGLVAAALALLACCAALGAQSAGWISRAASVTILQFALLVLVLALGGAMLNRMRDLRMATERAQAAQLVTAAHQAQELESLVAQRNAELSERLRDLSDTRRSAELANQSLQRALEQVEQAASTDRLTGAWNRRRFEEAVLPEIALANRRREHLALLMFDLDHFKRVNDTFGHGAGDTVLAATAQTVREHLRASDSLVRWGGEEFLVMAPATRLEGALGLAEKLRASMAAIEFPGVGSVTMSLGVSEYALGEQLEAWIERTDQALYRAKAEGRNRVAVAAQPEGPAVEPQTRRFLFEVIWEESFASGIALIDAQHKRLFSLASALMSTLAADRPLPEVSLRLETLLAHTAQHFHDEEALLREAQYPSLAEHAQTHATLLNQAWQLQAEVTAGRLDFGRLVSFLAMDLVKGHILTEDRAYFSHLVTALSPERIPPAGA